ncbi:MAG: hypothetical protein WAV40_01335 [Microgenomates group bacterium]
MKRLLALILLAGVIYGGYTFYLQTKTKKSDAMIPDFSNKLTINNASDKIGGYASVLGTSIEKLWQNGQEALSNATSGASQPIINELVSKTTDTLKDLPRKEADKIKYEFCKGVVNDYEAAKSTPSSSTKP